MKPTTAFRDLTTLALVLLASCSSGGGGPAAPAELAAIGEAQLLLAVDAATGAMHATTGQGPAGHPRTRAMALDSTADVLYLVENGHLLRVPALGGPTGLAQEPVTVGSIAQELVPSSLAWDAAGQQLYGVVAPAPALIPGTLVRIDPHTARTEMVATCAKFTSLTWDPASGFLFGLLGQYLVRVDPQTGTSVNVVEDHVLLPWCSGLTVDPLNGTFQTVHNPVGGPSSIVRVSLGGTVSELGTCWFAMDELALDHDSGRRLGLARNEVLVELSAGEPLHAWNPIGILGVRLVALAFDPNTGNSYGVSIADDLSRTLVVIDPDGRNHPVRSPAPDPTGVLEGDIQSLAFDPLTGELWGIDANDGRLVEIDTATATVKKHALDFSNATKLAFDAQTGSLYAYDSAAEVTLLLDPHADTWDLISNANGPTQIHALEYDGAGGRLVAAWDTDPSTSTHVELAAWNPYQSGLATGLLSPPFAVWALGRTALDSRFLAFSEMSLPHGTCGELFELELDASVKPRSLRSLWNRPYRAAVRAEELGRVFAIDGEGVLSIDPVSGETEYVGSDPFGGGATGLTWDPERNLLGFLKGDTLRWSGPAFPHSSHDLDDLGSAFESISRDPATGLYFACGDGGLARVAIDEFGAIVTPIGPLPAGLDVEDLAFRGGALHAATDDQRLFQVDTASGAWTEVGPTTFRVLALY